MNVFISSVVQNYSSYRAAAKKAVTLVHHRPVMCEDFGARPDSSEVVCMTEVDQADVLIVILGANFGFTTSTGESVTQQEFRRARASGKRVLAFLQDVPVEGLQADFRREVSDYVDGLFRVIFSNEQELSEGVVQALSQLAVIREAPSEEHFVERLKTRMVPNQWGRRSLETRFELAFMPQPATPGSLRRMHEEHENFFLMLCQAGLGTVKEGYQDFDQGDYTGIDTKSVLWRYHDSGLTWLSIALSIPSSTDNYFSSFYVSPSRVRKLAEASFDLVANRKNGWFQLGLYDLSNRLFREPPSPSTNSITMPFHSLQQIEERRLLIPASHAEYKRWLDDAFFLWGRKLAP
ncbi:DUF4062 domain-containing protein [Pseudomonas oryzihabitans]|uniref:DUF4062 domain-containing protein n=1 Tax=Pseudomonas oryzihabitans TaxID=47885 RepID=A0ABX3IZN9_9PSED|nr:DUF4062 domain-containing protein [Pseudomonas psychrotolerans]ONN72453.1 DUF4062 domain-containing protein [Pseudomonas psychrotolerans]